MKIILTTLCLIQITICVFSQTIPYYGALDSIDNIPCSYDTPVLINSVEGWDAYQTFDNTYFGTIDSNICANIQLETETDGIDINLEEFDVSRSIFLKARFTDSTKILLEPNHVFSASAYVNYSTDVLNFEFDCGGYFCTGAYFGVQLPDSAGTDTVMHWFTQPFDPFANSAELYACIVSEKMEQQYLRECILQFIPISTATTGNTIMSSSPYLDYIYDVNVFTDLKNSYGFYTDDSIYETHIYNISWTFTNLLKHESPGYPGFFNMYNCEISPNPNPTDSVSINLIIDEYYSLFSQSYVSLIGAYPEGDSSKRHSVSITSDGGTICLNTAFEIIFEGNENYRYNSGMVDFGYPTACFQFGKGGTLIVSDSATFYYGASHKGILAIRTGGTIEIGKNAELKIGNELRLLDYETDLSPKNVYMTLHEGSKLIFTKGSHITNHKSKFPNMQLVVYMNGGIFDDSGLSEADKKLIRRIYPAQENKLEDKIFISPNPVNDIATLEIQSEIKTSATISLIDINGKLLKTSLHEIQAGITPVYFDMKNVAPGFYLFTIELNGEVVGKKILKL